MFGLVLWNEWRAKTPLVRWAIGNVALSVIRVSRSDNDTMYILQSWSWFSIHHNLQPYSLAFYESLKKRRALWFMRRSSLSCRLNTHYMIWLKFPSFCDTFGVVCKIRQMIPWALSQTMRTDTKPSMFFECLTLKGQCKPHGLGIILEESCSKLLLHCTKWGF